MLKEYRLKNNLTQKELSKLLNMSNVAISNYELKKRKPTIEIFIKMASILKLNNKDKISLLKWFVSEKNEK